MNISSSIKDKITWEFNHYMLFLIKKGSFNQKVFNVVINNVCRPVRLDEVLRGLNDIRRMEIK